MKNLGICRYCKLEVPAANIDGTLCREGIEYKQASNMPEIVWHFRHPLFPNCYYKDLSDPTSPWYDDPWKFLDLDENESQDESPVKQAIVSHWNSLT